MSDKKNLGHNSKKDFLKNPIEGSNIYVFDRIFKEIFFTVMS